MTLEDQIQALLQEAEPLRKLPADMQGNLGAIVDAINGLRAMQAAGKDALDAAIEARDEAEFAEVAESTKPRRGRPPKARVEGADA